jgi:hypothetical protein
VPSTIGARQGIAARATVVFGALVLVAIYLLRMNRAAGLMVDDAYYVLLARALAEGHGYRLISSATVEMLPLYPPGFPFLLSLVFRVMPQFPDNVLLLKAVSAAALLATTVLTYVYLRQRQMSTTLSAVVAVAIGTMPALVFLATSTVMTECMFTLVQLAAVVALDRTARADRARATRLIAVGAVLTAAVVLIRSAGIGLAVAVVLWLASRHEWKRIILFGAVLAVCLLPWTLYARRHAPTTAERHQHGGAVVYSYQEQVWMRWAGSPRSGAATVVDLPARIATNTIDVLGRGLVGMFAPALLRGPAESGEEVVSLGGRVGIRTGSMGNTTVTMVVSCIFGAFVVIGFAVTARRQPRLAEFLVPVALAIILVWPFWSFRFLLPLSPYLFLYFATGLRRFGADTVARVAVLCVVGLNLADHGGYIALGRSATESRIWLAEARDVEAALQWLDDHAGGVVATTNPALVYLETGLKTISFDGSVEELRDRRDVPIRYVACLVRQQPPASPHFEVMFQTPSGFWVARVHQSAH